MEIEIPLCLRKVDDLESAPDWVIREVLECMGYKVYDLSDSEVRKSIVSHVSPFLQVDEITPRILARIGRFFNPHETWVPTDLPELIRIYNSRNEFIRKMLKRNPKEIWRPRYPTRKRIRSISSCMLWQFALELGLKADQTLDLERVQIFIYQHYQLEPLHGGLTTTYILNTLNNGETLLKINLRDSSISASVFHDTLQINGKPVPNSPTDDYVKNLLALEARVKRAEQRTANITPGLINRCNTLIHPTNEQEALIIMALKYERDVSLSDSPLQEYFAFINQSCINDPWLKAKVESGHTMDDWNLVNSYSLNLSSDLYARKVIDKWRNRFFLSPIENVHSFMTEFMLLNRFYPSKPLVYLNRYTPIFYDVVSELNSKDCVSFGTHNKLYVTTYDELTSLFDQDAEIKNPFTSFPFEVREVETLLSFLPEGELLSLARNWIRIQKIGDVKVRVLVRIFSRCEEEIKIFLDLLFTMAMMMRGWDEVSDYPIYSAPITEQYMIDIRVQKSILKLEDWVNSATVPISISETEIVSLGEFLYNLPMFDPDYKQITSEYEGVSIKARINIVKQGKKVVNSCIRMASNKLASTFHYYSHLLNLPTKFDLARMAKIV